MAKQLYEEFIGNSDLAFQDNILTSSYISKSTDKILPNSLAYELANDGQKSHQEQIEWIIKELEKIKVRAEKARLKGFDKKENESDVIRASLNFIDKKEKENRYKKNNYQNEKSNNWGKQNSPKPYNSSNTNHDHSNRNDTNFPTYPSTTRTTNSIMQYNDKHCKFYFDMQKYSCGARCNQDDIDPFYVEKRPWKIYWNPYVPSSNI